MSAQKRIEELINLINYHNDKYYNQDSPEIEDFEYDNLMKELIKLEEENPELKRNDSPSNRVGGKPLDKFEQVVHKIPIYMFFFLGEENSSNDVEKNTGGYDMTV